MRQMKNSPDFDSPVSRANSMDLPLGETGRRSRCRSRSHSTGSWHVATNTPRFSCSHTIRHLPPRSSVCQPTTATVRTCRRSVDRRSKILDDPPPGCALAHPSDVILSMPADSIRAEIQPAVGSGARKPLSPIRILRIRNANGCLPLTRRGCDVLPHEADQSSAPRASLLMTGHAGELRVDHHPCLRCAIWRIEQRDVGLRSIDAILQHRLVSPGRIGS